MRIYIFKLLEPHPRRYTCSHYSSARNELVIHPTLATPTIYTVTGWETCRQINYWDWFFSLLINCNYLLSTSTHYHQHQTIPRGNICTICVITCFKRTKYSLQELLSYEAPQVMETVRKTCMNIKICHACDPVWSHTYSVSPEFKKLFLAILIYFSLHICQSNDC